MNLLGQEVVRIFDGELSAGEHSFVSNAQSLAPEVYECVVRASGRVERVPIALVG